MTEAVIVSTARTPIGRAYKGALNNTEGATLLSHAISAAVSRASLDSAEVEDVVMGCAMQQGATGGNIARKALLRAGLPATTGGTTIDRQCASGLQAIALAARGARVIGLDQSIRQLRHATTPVPLVCASGEATPFADASFDLVFGDHGALSFCDQEEREFLVDIERLLGRSLPAVTNHPHPSPLGLPPPVDLTRKGRPPQAQQRPSNDRGPRRSGPSHANGQRRPAHAPSNNGQRPRPSGGQQPQREGARPAPRPDGPRPAPRFDAPRSEPRTGSRDNAPRPEVRPAQRFDGPLMPQRAADDRDFFRRRGR